MDVFAFGLCVLELATTKKLDHAGQKEWENVVELVQDEDTKRFIQRCVSLTFASSPAGGGERKRYSQISSETRHGSKLNYIQYSIHDEVRVIELQLKIVIL